MTDQPALSIALKTKDSLETLKSLLVEDPDGNQWINQGKIPMEDVELLEWAPGSGSGL